MGSAGARLRRAEAERGRIWSCQFMAEGFDSAANTADWSVGSLFWQPIGGCLNFKIVRFILTEIFSGKRRNMLRQRR